MSAPQPEPLACPFCKSEALITEHSLERTYGARCSRCVAQMPYVGLTEAEAIKSWNTRAPDTKAQALADALRDALAQSFTHYTARNGRQCSIEGDDGEQCTILPFDAVNDLRAALAAWDAKP